MDNARCGILLAIIMVLSVQTAARQGAHTTTLKVKHNRVEVPAPDQITLSSADSSVTVPVRGGKFEVPGEFVGAKNVTLSALVDGDQIRITGLNEKHFAEENWTLLLADKRRDYDENYRSGIPKGATIRSSCLLVLGGWVEFHFDCRSKSPENAAAPR